MSSLGTDAKKYVLLESRSAKKLLTRGGFSLVGVAVALACWTYGSGRETTPSQDHIPAKVGNGGETLEIQAQSSSPATIRISFEDLRKPVGKQQLLESWETMTAGLKSCSIDVPPGVGGYIELDADQPNVGDWIAIRVHVNGRLVDTESDKLEQPLEANEAFFVQDHFDDYSQAGTEDAEQ